MRRYSNTNASGAGGVPPEIATTPTSTSDAATDVPDTTYIVMRKDYHRRDAPDGRLAHPVGAYIGLAVANETAKAYGHETAFKLNQQTHALENQHALYQGRFIVGDDEFFEVWVQPISLGDAAEEREKARKRKSDAVESRLSQRRAKMAKLGFMQDEDRPSSIHTPLKHGRTRSESTQSSATAASPSVSSAAGWSPRIPRTATYGYVRDEATPMQRYRFGAAPSIAEEQERPSRTEGIFVREEERPSQTFRFGAATPQPGLPRRTSTFNGSGASASFDSGMEKQQQTPQASRWLQRRRDSTATSVSSSFGAQERQQRRVRFGNVQVEEQQGDPATPRANVGYPRTRSSNIFSP